ncbi:MAG: hypothetical protein P8166_10520 [Candidatus Thiodiazotropha sp.]
MTAEQVRLWLRRNPLQPIQVDCATAVMLKILDGKCKMHQEEKRVMALLYDEVKALPGTLFDADIHRLIADARAEEDIALRDHIYERRVLAETAISRPVMKSFKATIRGKGLFCAGTAERRS